MSARIPDRPGQSAIASKGWLAAHKWLLLRRISQLGILALFMISPWLAARIGKGDPSSGSVLADPALINTGNLTGFKPEAVLTPVSTASSTDSLWIIKGNLTSSLVLDVVPLTDPYVFLQMLATGFMPAATAVTGALILAAFYLLVGGRVFCSWVCPVNMITDAAAWTRRRLNIKSNHAPHANTRYWFLGGTFVAAALTGTLTMEWVNPVSIAHRGLFFGMGAGLWILVAVFLYDLFVASRGWCGHLCPMGAFYGLLGRTALLRVAAPGRDACDDCMDCFAICPEPQVIRPALKKAGQDSPVILDSRCTNCGRCIDVCGKQVFRLTHRFDQRSSS
ncbi:MAG: quinol dehydrogenase ferredoxin subunit NapH [Betaproteobacteria bacterium]|nr:quinol dehydrogenase ferredoxin subunit NapH [Betaproteobacteria bacterium]MCL2162509.1 quinol dehydrogenase ferredoxin subunit NapH [Betaproteobacteria bacterium]